MAEFDKTKKAIGVGGMAENERNDMLNKFKSAGGKVVREKEDKPQQQPRNTQKMKAVGGKDDKSKSSSSGSDRKVSPGMYRGIGGGDDDDEGVEVSITKAQIGAMDAEMSSFTNRMIIKFKCWANNVTSFGNKDLLPKFMSELRVEFQQALLEFKIAGNDILGNPQIGPKITRELDRISPIYVELIGRAHKIYDTTEINDLFADYASNPEIPVPINRVAKPVYSLFKKLYYLYPYQATYRKAVLTAYDILQRLENKPALIYSTKKKKISSEISVVFDKMFEKLYYIVIRNENKNIPMISLYMENLININDNEKPGKRKSGENLPLESSNQEAEQEKKVEESTESTDKKSENQELAYGRKLMGGVSIEQLRRKYDQRNELLEIPDTDKALLTYLFFKEFDYEYSFVLTTKKITVKPSNINGTKVDNKQKLLSVYELTRPCMEQFKIYVDVFKEQAMHKANPGTNYIEASKKTTGLEQKRSQQSRNVRVTIKDYIEKSYDSFNMLIDDMKGPMEIVGNMEEVIVFDSIESKKRLHKKPVKQCIMEAYCYSYAFATRLTEGGDLYGGVIELTPEEMLASFGKDLSGEDLSINNLMDTSKKSDPAIGQSQPREMGDL